MLSAHLMIRPMITTFEQRPKRFNAIGVNTAAHIFFLAMHYYVMACEFLVKTVIRAKFIAHNNCMSGNVFANKWFQCRTVYTLHRLCSHDTVPLLESKNRSLVGLAISSTPSMRFSTDRSFIDFDNSRKRFTQRTSTHGMANPVKHEPCGFLSHGNIFGKLNRANAFLVCHENVNRHVPFLQRQSRVLKDSTDTNGKLFSAVSTPKQFAVTNAVDFPRTSTMYASYFMIPTNVLKEFSARFFVRKAFNNIQERAKFWFFSVRAVCHIYSISCCLRSKYILTF